MASKRLVSTAAQVAQSRVVFSGIQPTGVPHIGNHLGALSQWQKLVKEQAAKPSGVEKDKLFFSVVGLHALTVPQNPAQLLRERREMFAVLLALKLDDPVADATLFHQDMVPEHAELAWYLNCCTSVGRLLRMTSWKSKLATLRNANSEDEVDDSLLQLGLLAYPVLQAADILLYKTTHVPVGQDQTQHLELARDLAQHFNKLYPGKRTDGKKGKGRGTFRVPEVMLTTHPRIQSLRNPVQKMSKSAPNPSSRIFMTDSPREILDKVKSAVTDSIAGVTYDPAERPGVSNLVGIHSGYSGESIQSIVERFKGPRGILELKDELGHVVVEGLREFRGEFERLKGDVGYVEAKERQGAERARNVARETMEQVRRSVGTL
ncbi:hypothetical protein JCM10212_004484 [Sporobolomyces blumeae]